MPTETITSADLLVVAIVTSPWNAVTYRASRFFSYQAALESAQHHASKNGIPCAILSRTPAGWTVLHTAGWSTDLLNLVLDAAQNWEEDRFANLAAEAE